MQILLSIWAALCSALTSIFYFFHDLIKGSPCLEESCGCTFYDDTETFNSLARQAHDVSYASRMIDAGVVGRPLKCDRCAHPREAHLRLSARTMDPEYMPNGGVVAIEVHRRTKLAKRAARFGSAKQGPKIEMEDIEVGDGNNVELDTEVLCTYEACFKSDGKQFEENSEFRFKVGAGTVVRGLDDGVRGMKAGGSRKLTIPPELAYGTEKRIDGRTGETLVFKVKVLAAVRS